MKKQLRRTVGNERKIAGVCGGIAKFFDLDPNLVRVLFVILALMGSGTGIIIYIVCAFIVPEDDGLIRAEFEVKKQSQQAQQPDNDWINTPQDVKEKHDCAPRDKNNGFNPDGTGKNGWN